MTRLLAVGAALLAVAVPAVAIAQDEPQPSKVTVMGEIAREPPSSCPRRPCEAVGRVSGYQVLDRGERSVFKAPADGRLIAWSLSMSKPKRSQIKFFDEFYGAPAQARISVLKPLKRNRFQLTGHGPVEDLTAHFGKRPIFALEQPLTVRKGYFVALTIPTWAPAFAVGLSRNSAWRASRPQGKCEGQANVQLRSSHERLGSRKTYGCVYRTARLNYRAWLATPR